MTRSAQQPEDSTLFSLRTLLSNYMGSGSLGLGFAKLAGGTIIGYVIFLVVSPVLTRLYSPGDFGALSVFSSIILLVLPISAGRYELAIPSPPEEGTAANLLALCVIIVIFFTVLSSLLIWFFGDALVAAANTPALGTYLWLLPLGLFGSSLYQTLNYWNLRRKSYGVIGQTKVVQSVYLTGTQTLVGLYHAGPLGLILGDVFGRLAGIFSLGRPIWYRRSFLRGSVTLGTMIRVGKRYHKFPLIFGLSGLLNCAVFQLPSVLLASFYGPQVAGYFSLSVRIISAPSALVGQAVSQVYWGEASSEISENSDGVERLYRKISRTLLWIGIIPTLILVLVAPAGFAVCFGETWREAGHYARLLSFATLAGFVVAPLTPTLAVLERPDLQLIWDAVRFSTLVTGMALARIFEWSPTSTITMFSMVICCTYVLYYAIGLDAIKKLKTGHRAYCGDNQA